MKLKNRYIFYAGFFLFCLSFFISQNIIMLRAASVQIKYDGEWIEYTSSLPDVYVNGEAVTWKGVPAFLIDGTFMVQADSFCKTYLDCEYSYDSGEKAVVLKKGQQVIEFYVGKTSAYVDGKEVAISVAPREVAYEKDENTCIVIPFKFVATQFNYNYVYDKSSQTISIHTINYLLEEGIDSYPADSNYKNVLKKARVYYVPSKLRDKVVLTGISKAVMSKAVTTISATNGAVTVDIPNTYIGSLDINRNLSESEYIKSVSLTQDGTNAHLEVILEAGTSAFTLSSGKKLTVFIDKEHISSIISLPEEVKASQVKDQDLYNSNKFVISIPGNHLTFYKNNPVTCDNLAVSKISYKLTAKNETRIIFKTTKIQGYKLYFNGDSSVLLSVGDPKDIFDKIVVLDAGHGGHDPGAKKNGTNEKDINYKVIYKYIKTYFSCESNDIKAYWTRTDDTFVTLSDRAAFAKKVGADLFISLHMNSADSSSANGTEVYYSTLNNSTASSGLTSRTMAVMFKNNLVNTLGTYNRGVKSANFVVIKSNTVPAVLIELGFLSGSSDYQKLTNTSFQKKAAKCIYDTIKEIFDLYPTKR